MPSAFVQGRPILELAQDLRVATLTVHLVGHYSWEVRSLQTLRLAGRSDGVSSMSSMAFPFMNEKAI